MRLYCFTNLHMNGINAGIQAFHAGLEMVSTAMDGDFCQMDHNRRHILLEWMHNHKTIIVLSGGEHSSMVEIKNLFSDSRNPFPWSYFEEPGLNNALTGICIVIPERLYDDRSTEIGKAKEEGPFDYLNFTGWERKFLQLRTSCALAK